MSPLRRPCRAFRRYLRRLLGGSGGVAPRRVRPTLRDLVPVKSVGLFRVRVGPPAPPKTARPPGPGDPIDKARNRIKQSQERGNIRRRFGVVLGNGRRRKLKTIIVPDDFCENCTGTGAVALHGIALTASDLNDWSSDEVAGYASGAYDTPCEVCNGSGRVSDEDADAYWQDLAELRMEAPHIFA